MSINAVVLNRPNKDHMNYYPSYYESFTIFWSYSKYLLYILEAL